MHSEVTDLKINMNYNVIDNNDIFRTILFPGMAGDGREFNGIENWNMCTVVNYNAIDFSLSVNEIVDRIIDEYKISNDTILVATSFGGLLATRIGTRIGNLNVKLYGALINKNEVPHYLRILARFINYKAIHISKIPRLIVKYFFGITTNDGYSIFIDMTKKYTCEKIRSMIMFAMNIDDIEANQYKRFHGIYDKLVSPNSNDIEWIKMGHIITMKNE